MTPAVPEVDHPLPLVVDSTILSTVRACGMKFFWTTVKNLRAPGLSVDLHAGGVFASTIETIYRSLYLDGLSFPASVGAGQFVFEQQWGDFVIPEWKKSNKTKDRMWDAVESYLAMYHPPSDWIIPWTDGGRDPFEFSFAIPLTLDTTGLDFPLHPSGDPFIYAGRFDAIGSHHGLPCVRDDKTTSYFTKDWEQSWDLRGQFLGYCWAMQSLGFDIDTVAVRGVAILKTEIQHREAIKQYPRFLVDRWLRQSRRDIIRILESFERGEWDSSLGTECTSYGGCAYVPLCTAAVPEPWESQYEIRKWNPLVRG